MQLKHTINKVIRDEFGRPTALLALNKPAGISSHDMVDKVRKQLDTRKVGHAGALDVFADGLVLILVGKATKKANQLLDLDKKYRAGVLLGVSTDTQDREGVVTNTADVSSITDDQVTQAINEFAGKTNQYVSLYSSVKVDGDKLRVLMRDDRYEKSVYFDDSNIKHLKLEPKTGQSVKTKDIAVPQREITIFSISLSEATDIKSTEVSTYLDLPEDAPDSFRLLTIDMHCSKGTYVRQFAEDLGTSLGVPASLLNLTRTAVADVELSDSVTIDSLS